MGKTVSQLSFTPHFGAGLAIYIYVHGAPTGRVDLGDQVLEAVLAAGEEHDWVSSGEALCDLRWVSDGVHYIYPTRRGGPGRSRTAPPVPAPTPATTAKKDLEVEAMFVK